MDWQVDGARKAVITRQSVNTVICRPLRAGRVSPQGKGGRGVYLSPHSTGRQADWLAAPFSKQAV